MAPPLQVEDLIEDKLIVGKADDTIPNNNAINSATVIQKS